MYTSFGNTTFTDLYTIPLSVCLSLYFSVRLPLPSLSVCLVACLSVGLSVYRSVYRLCELFQYI